MKNVKLMKIIIFFLVVLCFFIFTTCQGGLRTILQEPRASIRSVDIDTISLQGLDLIARVDVENPYSFDIPFPDIDWELFLNNSSFVLGELTNNTSLGRGRTERVDIPFSLSYAGLYESFKSIWENKEMAYKIALGISFSIPLLDQLTEQLGYDQFKFNLDHSGNITLLQMPKIQAGSFNVGSANLTGIEMDWGFLVDNPNPFPIPFPTIEWDYQINGRSLMRSTLNQTNDVPSLSQSPGNIKVSLLYSSIFSVLGSLGSMSEVPSKMILRTTFPIPFMDNSESLFEMNGNIPLFR